MLDKCCAFNCRSNYDGGPKETVFFFPDEKKYYNIWQGWIRFANREVWKPSKKSCIYWIHFEPHYYKTRAQGKRYRLVKKLKPRTTIFDPDEDFFSAESKHLKSPVSVSRKSPTKRVYQQDKLKLFEEQDKIKSFDDIDSTLTSPGYTFQEYDDRVIFYRLDNNVLNFPEVTDCVYVIETFMLSCFTRVHL